MKGGFRYFVCGPPRSGTSTVCHALKLAGINAVHGSSTALTAPLAVLLQRAWLEGRDPLYHVPRGVEALADPHLTRSPKYDLSASWPTWSPGFLEAVRFHHPDAWILMNSRPVDEWVRSVGRWKDLRNRIVKADLPFLPPGVGRSDEELGEWVDAYYSRVREAFAGDSLFIEFSVADEHAQEDLSARLGLELPWWGTRNANPEQGESES